MGNVWDGSNDHPVRRKTLADHLQESAWIGNVFKHVREDDHVEIAERAEELRGEHAFMNLKAAITRDRDACGVRFHAQKPRTTSLNEDT